MILKRAVLVWLIVYAIVAGGIIVVGKVFVEPGVDIQTATVQPEINQTTAVNDDDEYEDEYEDEEEDDDDERTGTTNTQSVTPAKPPTSTDPSQSSSCGSGGTCTQAEVAQHNTQTDCWVIYANMVYDVTGYVSRHPGGAGAFDASTCGSDISAQLSGSASSDSLGGQTKRHSQNAINMMAPYYIADLAP